LAESSTVKNSVFPSAAQATEPTFSARFLKWEPVRRSLIASVYWRKPVLSVVYARRLPSSLTVIVPSAMNFCPTASWFRSSRIP
jgi:hypothetical protein